MRKVRVPLKWILVFIAAVIFAIGFRKFAGDKVLAEKAAAYLEKRDYARAFALYDKLAKFYPRSPYAAKAMLDTIYSAPKRQIRRDYPIFSSGLTLDRSRPYSLNLQNASATGGKISNKPIILNKKKAEKLYRYHLGYLEENSPRSWCAIFNAGLEDKAFPYLNEYLKKANNYNVLECVVSYFIGKGDIDSALDVVNNFVSAGNEYYYADIYLLKAELHLYKDEIDLARDAANKAYELYQKSSAPPKSSDHPELFIHIGAKKVDKLKWFLPESDTSEIKIGVFINGIPAKDVLATLKYNDTNFPLNQTNLQESRPTGETGYTSTFLREADLYHVSVSFRPEEAAAIEQGTLKVIVKSQTGTEIKSKLVNPKLDSESKTIIHTQFSLQLAPNEKISVEFHILKPLVITASKKRYNANDSVELSWASLPQADFYRLTVTTHRKHKEHIVLIDYPFILTENSVILNDEFFREHGIRPEFFFTTKDGKVDFDALLGLWRGSSNLTLLVEAFTPDFTPEDINNVGIFPKEGENKKTLLYKINFPKYYSKSIWKDLPTIKLSLNRGSLESWEKIIVTLSLSGALEYFLETFSTSEIEQSPRLTDIYTALKKSVSYEEEERERYSLNDSKLLQLRNQAKDLVKEGKFHEAINLYEFTNYQVVPKALLEKSLLEIITRKNIFTQISIKEPAFDTYIRLTVGLSDEEKETIKSVAKALLIDDYKLAKEIMIEAGGEGGNAYLAMETLVIMASKYKVFVD